MKIKELKQEYIGKKLLSIISLNTDDDYIKRTLKEMTESSYSDIENAELLLFENNKALVFVDFDCDGYRSGNWYLLHLEKILDNGLTKGIKVINSIVNNIEFFSHTDDDNEGVLITTDEYLIKMGQHNVSDYYPSNFFDIDECREFVLGSGVIIDFDEDKK